MRLNWCLSILQPYMSVERRKTSISYRTCPQKRVFLREVTGFTLQHNHQIWELVTRVRNLSLIFQKCVSKEILGQK